MEEDLPGKFFHLAEVFFPLKGHREITDHPFPVLLEEVEND